MNEQQRKAMELALEALEDWNSPLDPQPDADIITAIKEALAQPELCKYGQERKSCTSNPMDCQCLLDAALAEPEQEPVGQLLENAFGRGQVMWFNKPKDESMLYTTPPQRKPLTDEELIAKALHLSGLGTSPDVLQFARAIEAAHGIKE